jgi:hypothetical protein
MPGALVHLFAAVLCLGIIHLIHFKWEYSLAAFVGNFIPDVIKFGFSAILQSTINVFGVAQDSNYVFLNAITSSYSNWFSLGFFLFGVTLLLYHFHIVKKKKMEEYDELYGFLLVGIILHLIMDVLFIEQGVWI